MSRVSNLDNFMNKINSNLLGSVSVFFTSLRKNKPRGQKRFWIRTQCKGGLYDRVACPKFRYPTLSSNFYSYTQNTEFVCRHATKKKTLFEGWTISKVTVNFKKFMTTISRVKIKISTSQVKVRTLDRVSAHYPR